MRTQTLPKGWRRQLISMDSIHKQISSSKSGQIRPPNENIARVSCDTSSWAFGTYNLMMLLFFIWWSRKGKRRVKLNQIKRWRYSYKSIPILTSFVSGFLKCHSFARTITRHAKNLCFTKVMSSPLPIFFHCTTLNKHIGFAFLSTCGLYVALENVFQFLDDFKVLDLTDSFF